MKILCTNLSTLSISLYLLSVAQVFAAEGNNTIDYSVRLVGLDNKIEQAITDFNLPSLALAVVVNGEVIKVKGYGYRDISQNMPATADTQYSIGSSTKAFTSFMLGTLVDDGKLEWDLAVKNYLPQWKMHDDYATNHVTLRDMLSHRTGLARHEFIWYANANLTIDDLLKKLPNLESSKELRQGFEYNNLMYAIAGYLAETTTAQQWDQLIQGRILDKLNMTNTSLNYIRMQASGNYSLPYEEDGQALKKVSFNKNIAGVMRPAGVINSSARDMSKWLLVLLDNGQYNGQQVIQKASLEQLQSPQIAITGMTQYADISPLSYGMGWFTQSYKGHYQVQHGGNIDGYTSAVFTYPKDKIGIVVLTNKNHSPVPHALALAISDSLFNLKDGDHLAKSLLKKQSEKEVDTLTAIQNNSEHKLEPTLELSKYTGNYYNSGYGKVCIETIANGLQVSYMDIQEQFEYDGLNTFVSRNTFKYGIFEGERLSFNIDDKGVVAVNLPFEQALESIKFTKQED